MQFFLLINNQQRGPYNDAQIREFLAQGHLTLDSQVWPEGAAGWMPLRQVSGFTEQQDLGAQQIAPPIIQAPAPLSAQNEIGNPIVAKTVASAEPANIPQNLASAVETKGNSAIFISALFKYKHLFLFAFLIVLAVLWSRDSNIELGAKIKPGHKVLILLHGYGAPPDDLVGPAEKLSALAPMVSFILPPGPHRVGCSGRSWRKGVHAKDKAGVDKLWNEQKEQARNIILDIVKDLHDDGIPAQDILVGGFSEGAIVAIDFVLNNKTGPQVGGLVSLSGRLPKNFQGPALDPNNLLKNRDSLRAFISHGKSDSVVHNGDSKKLVAAFKEHKLDVTFKEFPGGHTIAAEVIAELGKFLNQ